MSIAIVTGSGGFNGSQAVSHFSTRFEKIGIDNDSRSYSSVSDASMLPSTQRLFPRRLNDITPH